MSLRTTSIAAVALLGATACATEEPPPEPFPAGVDREVITIGYDGEPPDGSSRSPAISADGRVVAFTSQARNLEPEPLTASWDVFVRDRSAGEAIRVSRAMDGGAANGRSFAPDVSDDGRFVVFVSEATNLVPGAEDWGTNVYLYDRELDTLELISRNDEGQPVYGTFGGRASISPDGRHVAFRASAANLEGLSRGGDVYLRDLDDETTTLVSTAPADSEPDYRNTANPSVARDGAAVAFTATGQFDPDDYSPGAQVFLWRREEAIPRLVSGIVGETPCGAARMDDAGRRLTTTCNYDYGEVSFAIFEPDSGDAGLVAHEQGCTSTSSISADGRYVAFACAGDEPLPGEPDEVNVFVRDVETGESARLTSDVVDAWAAPAISADGRYVAFATEGTRLETTSSIVVAPNPLEVP